MHACKPATTVKYTIRAFRFYRIRVLPGENKEIFMILTNKICNMADSFNIITTVSYQ